MVRPLLRWAGSKRSALRYIEKDVPETYCRYFEPFVGSAALFFSLQPPSAVLSDLNVDLINFYKQSVCRPREVFEAMRAIPREKEAYLKVRSQFKIEKCETKRATQFYYLNRNCFNGLYRTNKRGEFNVPFAAKGRSNYPTYSEFKCAIDALSKAEICVGDFFEIVGDRVNKDDFVYMDPPYLMSQGRIFSEYVKGHFYSGDMERFSELLKHIDSVGAKFIVSFIDDEIIRGIQGNWNTRKYEVQRNISGFTASRRQSGELLIKNW